MSDGKQIGYLGIVHAEVNLVLFNSISALVVIAFFLKY